MLFIDYTRLEEIIFKGVKSYFEALEPLASDDYKNAFYDLVAQYGFGGEDYLGVAAIYDELIEATILEEYNKFSNTDKKEIQVQYERNFLEYYYDEEKNDYYYSDEQLSSEIASRFKSWMDDNYSLDALLDEDDEVDEEEEEDQEEDENK